MTPFSVLLLGTETRTQNHYIVLALADSLRRHPAVSEVVVAEHADAIDSLHGRVIDVFIAFGGARAHAPILGRLAALARYSVLWITEDPYELAANLRFSTAFDLVFTNDLSSIAAYEGRARHLPLAATTLFQDYPVQEQEQDYLYDLLFIGTAWPNRVKTLNAIAEALPSTAKLKLALPWNEFIGPPALRDPSRITDWRCGNRDFARMANRSRVVLTLPRAFSASNVETASGSTPPPRLFEAAIAGGFQVVVAPDPEVHVYYDSRSEICICQDEVSAVAAILEHLGHPELRIEKAKAARLRTLREHLYDHRVETLVNAIQAGQWRPSPTVASLSNGRKTVLVLTHNRSGHRPGGGVEVYQELLTSLQDQYQFLFLFPVLRSDGWDLRLQGDGLDRIFPCGLGQLPESTNPLAEVFFQEILFDYKVDLLHINHLLHLPLSLPIIAKACGVPVIYQLHDHYLICERWLLLDQTGRFCDVAHRGPDQCDACLIDSTNYPAGAKARRDGMMSGVVQAVDAFVTSTPATGAYLALFYPEIAPSRIVEIEMLSPSSRSSASEVFAPAGQETGPVRPRLVVAIIGNFLAHKGGDAIIDVMRLSEGRDIRFEVFGSLNDHHRGRIAGLPPGIVTLHGTYDQRAIVAMLNGCDVSLHLSTWPETYVLALTEAWLAGLVPIVSDLGALGERVRDGIDGFVVRPHHPGGVMARLLELYYDPSRLAEMKEIVRGKNFPSVKDHLQQLSRLYRDLILASPCPHDRVPDRARGPFDLSLEALGTRLNATSWASAAIGWDPDPAAPLATALANHADVPLTTELDPEHRDYHQVPVSLTGAETNWSLDELRIDDVSVGFGTGREVAVHHISVRGWLRHAVWSRPVQTYLRFVGSQGDRYARLHQQDRHDLAMSFGEQAASRAGFLGRVCIIDLAPGSYRVDLVQVANGRLLIAQGCLRFYSGSRLGVERKEHWIKADCVDTESDGSLPIVNMQHNLQRVGEYVIARSIDDWAVAVTVGCAQKASRLQAVLVPDHDGPSFVVPMNAVAEASASKGQNPHVVGFVASFRDLPIGRYTLAIRGSDPDVSAPAVERIDIAIGTEPYRMVHSPPQGFVRWSRRRLRRRPVIEHVTPIREPGFEKHRIALRGWAFVRGLGAPIYNLIEWRSGNRREYCVSTPLARPEIGARLDQSQADVCGFTLAFPAEALAAGRLRFFQCYENRIVEFLGFDKEIRIIINRQKSDIIPGDSAGRMEV